MNTMTEAKNLAASRPGRLHMTAAAAFVETLAAHNVKEVFGVIGTTAIDALDPLHAVGIRVVSVAHGQSAAHMADGFARIAGQPAVCIAEDGPGLTSFVTAIEAAYWARTPLVVVTHERGISFAGRGGLQPAGLTLLSRITKWQACVSSSQQVAELMHRAFAIAVHERGPVQVSIAADGLDGEGDYEILPPLVIEGAAGGAGSLAAAASMLAAAKFPVIMAGEDIATTDAVEAVKTLAEHLTAPVVNGYRHNDSFPGSHPLACGPLGIHGSLAATRILARADVVLALGAQRGPVSARPEEDAECWPEGAKIIQIDNESRALALARMGSLPIEGDVKLAARELLKQLKARAPKKPDKLRLAEVQREREAWAAELAAWPSPNRKGQIGARRALAQLEKALPRNATVATDIGGVCSIASSYLRFEQPLSYLAPMGRSVRGCAYPTALGARLARPDRPAIAYVGDGAWGMGLADVMTAVKERIPAVAVVFNNGQWGTEKRVAQGEAYDPRYTSAYPANPDFSEVAQVMGAEGYRVEHEDEVADALKAALKSGKPAVVEIMLTREAGDILGRDASRRARRPLIRQREPGTVE